MTLNCFSCFNRKPTPHAGRLYHGCCSAGSTVCACTLLESGVMSLLSLTRDWVCLPDRKCMLTWPLAIGVNTRKDTGAGSCVLPEVFLHLANVTSVTNEPAALMRGRGVVQLRFPRFSLWKAAASMLGKARLIYSIAVSLIHSVLMSKCMWNSVSRTPCDGPPQLINGFLIAVIVSDSGGVSGRNVPLLTNFHIPFMLTATMKIG